HPARAGRIRLVAPGSRNRRWYLAVDGSPVRARVMSIVHRTCWGMLPLVLLVACERTPEPRAKQESAPSAASAAPTAAAARTAQPRTGVIWSEPEGWVKESRPRPMRLATYSIPKSEKDPENGELAVFH